MGAALLLRIGLAHATSTVMTKLPVGIAPSFSAPVRALPGGSLA